jgi:hypothetical protein
MRHLNDDHEGGSGVSHQYHDQRGHAVAGRDVSDSFLRKAKEKGTPK